MKVLLIKDNPQRSELLRQALHKFGHSVVAEATMRSDLIASVVAENPDLLVIDSNAPSDALLARLADLSEHKPLPMIVFTGENNRDIIQKALKAGVSAYIVDGLEQNRLGSILDVAIARFHETDRLRRELADTRASLEERKTVERAKGILMEQRSCSEAEAYHALRKMAMNKNLRIGQVAENVIAVAELLN